MADAVSDRQRENIQRDIAAALLLLYRGRRAEALKQIGNLEASGDVPLDAVTKLPAHLRRLWTTC
jgi:hypothetical protein